MPPQPLHEMIGSQAALTDGLNQFGINLLRVAATGDTAPASGNVIVSGLSLGLALLMTCWGARGETALEISSVLGLEVDSDWHAAAQALSRSLGLHDRGRAVRLANALWARSGYRVRPAFVAECAHALDAAIEALDFDNALARARINGWVSEQTDGAIAELLPSDIHPLTVLFITNALYFAAQWATPFDAAETQPAPFVCWDGQTRDIAMMRCQGKIAYIERDRLQAVRLPFAGESLCLDVILPTSKDALDELVQHADHPLLCARARFVERPGVLHLPRLDLACTWHMSAVLRRLGMRLAFDASHADLRGISADALSEGLYVSRVLHNTRFRVDESGAEAAAAAAVEMRLRGLMRPEPPFEMTVDRPFLFLLREIADGAVLMQGIVGDPSPQQD